MKLINKKHYKISNVSEKLSLWQQELETDISKIYYNFKESQLYFVLKKWITKTNSEQFLPDIITNSNTLNPDDEFIVVNKTTWYSIKGKIKVKQIPVRKIGYFCNKKLVFLFDNFCYFFYKDKNLDFGKIYEGYLSFINKHNVQKVVYLLESNEINNFFSIINADITLYKQILYYKGNTFELILKNNINNRLNTNKVKGKIVNIKYSNNIIQRNQSDLSSTKKKFSTISIDSGYQKNISIDTKDHHHNSAENISIFDTINNYIQKSQRLNREKSCINIKANNLRNSYFSKNQENILQHFPNRKLSKTEDENLNKILKTVIHYYCFHKNFMKQLSIEQEVNDLNLCMINKDWLKFFINKFNFYKIKEYLDKKYENVNPNFYLEYKECLIKACRIKDFLLVKTKPIKPLEKDFTEFGQEYYNNYDLINKNIYQLFKEAFGSYELNEVREFKVNIIKKRGIIINFNHEQIEVNKMYMYNENKNLKPERYLIVLSNSKYMNFRVKRPLEENGIDEGLKLIPTEQNEEDDEEYFKIKLNNEIIGSLINITNPINRTFGNFIPSKPCLKGLEKNDIIYSMNSVIQCLNNIPPLIGYFLNKKRMIQIYNTKETKPLSNKILEIFKELWLNDNEESGIISCKDVSDYLLELNPFFSGNDSNAKELLYYIINLIHQELNKIENINHYLVNDKIKFNYQLCFENYYNYYKSNYKSIISDIFYGFKNDTLTCSKCSNTSHSINLYDILIFPTDEIKNFKNYSSDSILIEECFEYNERKIDLYNCRNYLCNFCNNYANGVLTTKLVLLPKILIVAFDRKEEKDFNVKVNFDEFLDLRKFVFYDSKIYKYELIGVIKNINKFNEIKKYIAFCKSCANKNWYLYDDMNVTKADFKDVKEIGNVDILIYNNYVYNK